MPSAKSSLEARLRRDLIRDNKISSVAKEFLIRMRSVVFMRSLMLTKRFNFLGIVPETSENGDLVCIIFGCSVPIVLRQMERDDGGAHFEVVGECYVHGMMDGGRSRLSRSMISKDRYLSYVGGSSGINAGACKLYVARFHDLSSVYSYVRYRH
jgi:hypothetical protein